jgi:hypothetical protein
VTGISAVAGAQGTHDGIGAPPSARPDFEIVPRKGLIVVAIVFVALIVAIAVNSLWPLMFLHVAFGGAWTIIDLFIGLVLGPILGRLSIPARIELTTKLMPPDGSSATSSATCSPSTRSTAGSSPATSSSA